MIDIEKAEEEFKKYTSQYDRNEERLNRKISHTFRVENICECIAISIGMKDEEILLAKLIGLLHDIARFEQYTIYKTFSDYNSIDHGDLAVEILEKEDYIRQYIEDTQYDRIIKIAIKNHNKYAIQEDLDEKERVFCQIIRDADKLDIFYQVAEMFWNGGEDVSRQTLSSVVFEQFMAEEIINSKNIKTRIDHMIKTIGFIYDINFIESYKIIQKQDYISKIINQFAYQDEKTKQCMKLIEEKANTYIKEKIE